MGDYGVWGEADITYPDWQGTAQLDQAMNAPQLEELVGLDLDEWMIVGIEIGGGEYGHDMHVKAVRRDLIHEAGHLGDVGAANGGELPATDFKVHDVDPYELLKQITHVFELRLRPASLERVPIRIVELADLPPQDD